VNFGFVPPAHLTESDIQNLLPGFYPPQISKKARTK